MISDLLFDRIYEVSSNIKKNCVPWKIANGKSISIPPKEELNFCDWLTNHKEILYDVIFVSDGNLVTDWDNLIRHSHPHAKIYVIQKSIDQEKRTELKRNLHSKFLIGLVYEKTLNDETHFVFRPPRFFKKPLWNFEEKCTILVHDMAGFGDEFNAARYVDFIHCYNTKVVFEARPEIYRFMKLCSNYDDVIFKGQDYEYDFQINTHRLMKFFGKAPKRIPYFKIKVPETHLLKTTHREKIGFVYKGGSTKSGGEPRSYSLDQLKEITKMRTDLYCLQKDDDIDSVNSTQNWYFNLSNDIQDWYDTACYVSQMNCILTPDTAMLHLSSSLGIETKVFLDEKHTNIYISKNDKSCLSYPDVLQAYWGKDAITKIVNDYRLRKHFLL
jgi:hypothetical protein